MTRTTLCLALMATALLCVTGSSRAALTIAKVLPFATDRDVRVQVALQSDRSEPIELDGTIVPADQAAGASLWQGSLGRATIGKGTAVVETTVTVAGPRLWSPGSPALYNLTVTAKQGGKAAARQTVRFGFRSVTAKEGRVLLNGKPIFLRGIAINPPGRDISDDVGYSHEFAHAYVRYLRTQNVNLIRLSMPFRVEERQQVWLDVCDELGMLLYQGNYGAPPAPGGAKGAPVDPEEQTELFAGKIANAPRTAKTAPPEDFEGSLRMYKSVFETYVRHPSVIIYVLSNELPGPVLSNPGWHEFLTRIDQRVNEWDPTRLVIGNAGYGLGREGDINDAHRYWGWYYKSFLTYYNLRDSVGLFGESTLNQPLTFSECVGSYTSPLGSFNAILSKQLAPQLEWTGHSGNQRRDALDYQAFMTKRAIESFRTMREQNYRMAGLMPFTILFHNWQGIRSFEDMMPKPAMEQMGRSYSPILTSIELWTRQVYAGSKIRPVVHVVNDSEDYTDLTGAKLWVTLSGKTHMAVWERSLRILDLPKIEYYYDARAFPVPLTVPHVPTGEYSLVASLMKDEEEVSRNQETIYISAQTVPADEEPTGTVLAVYDPSGRSLRSLLGLHVNVKPIIDISSLPPGTKHLVLGQDALATTIPTGKLRDFVAGGGRVLCLAQDAAAFDTSWLPARIEMLTGTVNDPTYPTKVRPTADGHFVNPERPWHPVFEGIGRERLRLWSDYTDWDQSKPGFPKVLPVTHGFRLTDAQDLAKTAILANYDRGLEGVAIAEMFDGQGSVILTGLDLVNRVGLDPIADRMLANLAAYLTAEEHEVLPLAEKPIVWGNYPTEHGVLTGPIQGLIYNCRWITPPTDPGAKPMADNTGMWNSHPGNPFEPVGVRPFGPYEWSTGASPRERSQEPTGTGVFYCRVPAGRKVVLTKVDNPGKDPRELAVSVNEGIPLRASVAPGQTTVIRAPIPAGATDLCIRYTGHKQLVILETAFE